MTTTAQKSPARRRGRPEGKTLSETFIAMYLPVEEKARAIEHARREDRTMSSFARRIFLIGFKQYEASLANNSNPA